MRVRRYIPLLADLLMLAALHYYPIRDGPTRTAIAAGALLLLPLTLAAVWQNRWLRRIALGLNAAMVLVLSCVALLPARGAEPAELQDAYLSALASYEATPYVWGGETHDGIDCSGLPRMARVKALLSTGISHADFGLLREAAWLWWNDSSARNFTTGYSNRLTLIAKPPADLQLLAPGDLAITPDGVHTLIYAGQGRWIQADPVTHIVHTSAQPEERMRNMIIMRWARSG